MQLPRKPKKSAIGCSSLARPRQSRPCLSPSTTSSLVTKRRRKRATPRQRQMPAPRGQRADTQELKAPPAAASTARPPDETQRGIRKKDARGDGSKIQGRTARVSAGEGGKQKPEPRPGLVAPPAVRPPDEKQSATPTEGAPQDEALQEGIPAEIKFGMLDGNAVRFTSREAWWLVDGVWRPISPGEVLLNAAVMREARYDQFFPEVPPLPSHAFKADNLKI